MDLIVVFPGAGELEKARALLAASRMNAMQVQPASALVTDSTGLSTIQQAAPRITIAGWTEYRPGACPPPVRRTFDEDLFGDASIMFFGPCMADETKLRFIAQFDRDISEVMPYLNARIRGAVYSRRVPTLGFPLGQRMVTLYGTRLVVGKTDEIVDTWRTMAWVKDLINET